MQDQANRSRGRGRSERLSSRQQVADGVLLLLACLAPLISFVILGGARDWLAFPMLIWVFSLGILFSIRNIALAENAPSPPPLVRFGYLLLVFLAIHGFVVQGNWGGARDEWLHVAGYLVTYIIVTCLCRYNRRAEFLLAAMVLIGSLQAWYALGLHFNGSTAVLIWDRPNQYGMRASGTFICPNHYAQALTTLIVMAMIGLVNKGWSLATRMVCGYALCVMIPAQLLSLSRAGLLGLLSGIIVFSFLISFKKSRKVGWLSLIVVPVVSSLAAASVWFYMPGFKSRILYGLKGDIRLSMWADCQTLIEKRWLLGYGGATFIDVFSQFREHFSQASLYLRFAHNEFIHYWAEYGLIGLALFVGLGLSVLVLGFRVYFKADRANQYAPGAGLIAVLVATGVHSFFDFNFHMFSNVMLLVLFAAVVFSGWNKKGVLPTRRGSVVAKKIGNIGFLLFCVLALLLSVSRVLGIQAMTRAAQSRLALDPDKQYAYLERAVKMDVFNHEPYKIMGRLNMSRSRWARDEDLQRAQGELALQHYKQVYRRNPWDVEPIYGQALQYFEWGENEKALELISIAVEKDPFYAEYYVQKGIILRAMGRSAEALEIFYKAQKLDPDSQPAQINIQKISQALKNS